MMPGGIPGRSESTPRGSREGLNRCHRVSRGSQELETLKLARVGAKTVDLQLYPIVVNPAF